MQIPALWDHECDYVIQPELGYECWQCHVAVVQTSERNFIEMSSLKLALLGPLQMSLEGIPLTGFSYNKTKALLCYLAVTKRVHNRHELVSFFWPDIPEKQGRKNLRNLLSDLRRTVAPHVVITHNTVAFNQEASFWLDIDIFVTALASNGDDLQTLDERLSLYRDDFLAGFYVQDARSFEEWVVMEREYLHNLAVERLDILVRRLIEREEYEVGLALNKHLLALEPWRETAHQQQMILLAYCGQHGAALVQYETCRTILADEFDLDPAAETTALCERIRARRLGRCTKNLESAGDQSFSASNAQILIDWGEMPQEIPFYGRQTERNCLAKWLLDEGSTLVGLFGLGGQGKTALVANLVRSLVERRPAPFARIIWRSLRNAPPFANFLQGCLQRCSAQPQTNGQALLPFAEHVDEQVNLLFENLQRQRCLLILDNVESILHGSEQNSGFRSGYECYGNLIRRMAQGKHQSCILLISQEQPQGFRLLEMENHNVKFLTLTGLSTEAALEMLTGGRVAQDATMTKMVERYDGHPLSLKLVTMTGQALFSGELDAFFTEETLIFGPLQAVLDKQFVQLSELEKDLLIWLAIEQSPVSLPVLERKLVRLPTRRLLLDALWTLQRRSLLQVDHGRFGLSKLLVAYLIEHLVQQVCWEIETNGNSWSASTHYLSRFALVQTHDAMDLRNNQKHQILQSITNLLLTRWSQSQIEEMLQQMWNDLGTVSLPALGYTEENLQQFLLHIDRKVKPFDYQYDLERISLLEINLAPRCANDKNR